MTASPHLPLGWPTMCLAAAPLEPMLEFYVGLGFTPVGGDAAHGYVVVNHGSTELCLMSFLSRNLPTWRGANVAGLAKQFAERGLAPFYLSGMNPSDTAAPRNDGYRVFEGGDWPKEYTQDASGNPLPLDGSGDFLLEDPDGTFLYFDSVPVERHRFERGERFSSEKATGELAPGSLELGPMVLQLAVADPGKSSEFYNKLGFQALSGRQALELELATPAGACRLGLSTRAKQDALCFECLDLERSVQGLRQRGITFEGPSADGDGAARAALRDPQNNVILLRQAAG